MVVPGRSTPERVEPWTTWGNAALLGMLPGTVRIGCEDGADDAVSRR